MSESVILAVDPDQTVLSFIRRTVVTSGHLFCGARRGADAIRKANAATPAAAFLRLGVSDMSGPDLVARFRAEIYATPVILMAREGQESEITAGLEMGAIGHMVFPFSDAEVLARLNLALRRGREAAA